MEITTRLYPQPFRLEVAYDWMHVNVVLQECAGLIDSSEEAQNKLQLARALLDSVKTEGDWATRWTRVNHAENAIYDALPPQERPKALVRCSTSRCWTRLCGPSKVSGELLRIERKTKTRWWYTRLKALLFFAFG